VKRISTRGLKRTTAILVILAFVLMFAGPWVIRRPATMKARPFALRLAAYSGALGFCAIASLAGAYIILRREQDAYRERALENMRDLIEGTRQDRIAKRSGSEDGEAHPGA
jgi:hypothetical protein